MIKNMHNCIIEKRTVNAIENAIQETVVSIHTPKESIELADTFWVKTKRGNNWLIYFFRYGTLQNSEWIVYAVPEGGTLNANYTKSDKFHV
jgi:hypothetical protein